MSLLALATGLAILAGLGLGYVRLRTACGEAPRGLQMVALIAALGVSVATIVFFLVASLEAIRFDHWFDVDTLSGMAAFGATIGALLAIMLRLLFVDLMSGLWHWACRSAQEVTRSWTEFLTTTTLMIIGVAAAFALTFAAGLMAYRHTGTAIWLFPLFVALIPLYEMFALPWVQYARGPTLASAHLAELQAWIEEQCGQRHLPRVRVRIQRGSLTNAFAIGGFGAHLVVLGQGLVEQLSVRQLQAVIAHELAHVARKDVPRLLLPLAVVGGTLNALVVVNVCHPLFATFETWPVLVGLLLTGLSASVFGMLMPGVFMRRMELKTDQLAVEMLGDGDQLAEALVRLSELSSVPISKRTWSHPSVRTRVDAIRSGASVRPSEG